MVLVRNLLFFFALCALGGWPAFAGESFCEAKFGRLGPAPTATVVKLRKDGTRILRLVNSSGVSYFREMPMASGAVAQEKAIFDDPRMPGLVFKFTRGLGLEGVVPQATYEKEGIEVVLDGHVVKTRPGAVQAEVSGLTTPIDEWKKLHPGKNPKAKDIAEVLSTGEWPRLYANWKILWRLMGQVDLSIENLAEKDGQIAVFDLGDAFNLPKTRARMGVSRDLDNMNFNMPGNAFDRVEYRADLRRADKPFRDLARKIATESDEETAARLGMKLDDRLPEPRGTIGDHVASMKFEARRILEMLDADPFGY